MNNNKNIITIFILNLKGTKLFQFKKKSGHMAAFF